MKVLSFSSCTVSEASSLLQRFLSGDACSDSLARDYAANVAQALQDSISRRAGESGAPPIKHLHFSSSSHLSSPSSKELVDGRQSKEHLAPSSAHGKLQGLEKQRSHSGKVSDGKPSLTLSGDDDKGAGVMIMEADNGHKRHKKKRRHSAVENGTETVSTAMQEADGSASMHHDKKRRKKEKIKIETEHFATENSTPDTQKRRKNEKRERESEQIRMESVPVDDQKRQKKEKNDKEGEHIVTEIVTPVKERHHEKKKRKDKQEADAINIETATPTLDDRKSHEKRTRKKEKQGTENVEIPHANEIVSPPASILFGESLDLKSAAKGKKKRDAGSLGANRMIESGLSDMPLSPSANEKEVSSKRKKKEEAGVLATLDKFTPKKDNEEPDIQSIPEEFGSFNSEEKKRKRKKRKSKGELEFN